MHYYKDNTHTINKYLCSICGRDEKDDAYSARFSPDSQFVVAGGGDGGIRVYNANSGKLTYLLVSFNLPLFLSCWSVDFCRHPVITFR